MTTTTLKVKASAPEGQPTIMMEREFDAPPDAVFRAHTDSDALKIWYGPDGFTNTIISMDFRVGGEFRFIMHAPDGTNYTNRMTYREIVPAKRLAYLHDCGVDSDPHGFEVITTFEAIGQNRTLLKKSSVFPSVEARNAVMKFGAVELGMQTLEKLAVLLKG